jgi:hypothetical protein
MPVPVLAAKLAFGAIFGRVGKALKAVPWQVWVAVAALALIGIGSCVHENKVERLRKEAFSAGVAAEKKATNERLAKMHKAALKWKAVAEARAARISQEIRNAHEQTLRDNSARADDLRLRGPGAARCRPIDNSGVPTAPSGSGASGGGANAAGTGVPADDELAAVPWGWLVGRAEQCDANRSENLSWREFYRRQAEVGVIGRATTPRRGRVP